MTTEELDGVRVAVLVANEGIEQVELTEPWQAIFDAVAMPGPYIYAVQSDRIDRLYPPRP